MRSKLTKAHIQKNTDPDNVILKISLSDVKDSRDYPNLLIVKSILNGCKRITIYPINRENLIKVEISGNNISEDTIADLSKIFQNFVDP